MARFFGKLPTNAQGVTAVELKPVYWDFGKPAAADADGILAAAVAAATAVELDEDDWVTTFDGELDVPRQVAVIASAGAASIKKDDTVTIYGTNYAGEPISEVLKFAAEQTTAKVTAQAFKTVTKVIIGASTVGVKFNVGWTDVLGLPFKLAATEKMALEYGAGVLQTTAGTFAVDASVLGKNTYDPNTSLNGSNTVQLILFL
ncbi:MAG TPA: hypothetical protein PLE92_08940 [Lentisphaeria bacterium]|nr:hypothetical protein [Lentisphaeria bacterium]